MMERERKEQRAEEATRDRILLEVLLSLFKIESVRLKELIPDPTSCFSPFDL
jgi:hypothetical protein